MSLCMIPRVSTRIGLPLRRYELPWATKRLTYSLVWLSGDEPRSNGVEGTAQDDPPTRQSRIPVQQQRYTIRRHQLAMDCT